VRVDGIGDALACVPLLASLRAAGHRLGALLTTRNAEVFAPRAFERVHVVERIPWPHHGYTETSWNTALRGAQEARYDIALVASEEPAAYSFARRAGISRRIGFHNGLQKPLKSWWARRQLTRAIYRPATQAARPRHEAEVMYELGRGLHAESEPTHDPSVLRELILEHEVVRSGDPAIQITSKWLSPSRGEDAVRPWFAQLAAAARWSGFCSHVERALGERLGAAAGLEMRYFDSVKEWKEAIAAAPYLITPDTGAAHVAGMLCVPCTDIFETSDYAVQAARWSPWCGAHVLRAFPADNAGVAEFARVLAADRRRA
jgi:ADP-heptose:LPS heptosyltransferase